MDRLYELMLNPNHEMPSGGVLFALFALCIIVPYITRFLQNRRDQNRKGPPASSGKKKKKK